MSNKGNLSIILLAVGAALVTLLGIAQLTRVGQTPVPKPTASVKPSVTPTQKVVKLSLSVAKKSLKIGESIPVSINLDTLNTSVRGVEAEISFDPNILEVVGEATPGKIFVEPIIFANRVDNNNGKVLLAIGSFTPYMGTGVYGMITFKAKTAASSSLIKLEPAPKSKITVATTHEDARLESQAPINVVISQN